MNAATLRRQGLTSDMILIWPVSRSSLVRCAIADKLKHQFPKVANWSPDGGGAVGRQP